MTSTQLSITLGQHSERGCKPLNQDFHGAIIPQQPLLSSKGIAIAMADSISSSKVSQCASELSIKSFLEDYYATSESWSVKTSVQRVLQANNSWLYAQNRHSQYRYNLDHGYVCTFSALLIKSTSIHLFNIGDTRIYRVHGHTLEQLTEDHRLPVSQEKSYLSRALGIREHLELDYRTVAADIGDLFILATDGVYEHISHESITWHIHRAPDLDSAAKAIVAEALNNGSDDNLSIQILRIEQLPSPEARDVHLSLESLPLPPPLTPRMVFDGYTIVRSLHASHRSHVYLVTDPDTQQQWVMKTPSTELSNNSAYLENLLMEEWVARRINSPHVLKAPPATRKRNYLYTISEYIEGQTLHQWMIDHPQPALETVRNIIQQIAKGLHAFHRQEMLHRDLRPENILIDATSTVKIIDFGSVYIAGVIPNHSDTTLVPGTVQYSAPEYFLGESGSIHSDLFSLGVISYQMLSGKLPYGLEINKCRSKSAQRGLRYQSLYSETSEIPAWVDDALKQAVQINPQQRYAELSEFTYDLRHPNQRFLTRARPPLIERNPVMFWQGLSLILGMLVIYLLNTL